MKQQTVIAKYQITNFYIESVVNKMPSFYTGWGL